MSQNLPLADANCRYTQQSVRLPNIFNRSLMSLKLLAGLLVIFSLSLVACAKGIPVSKGLDQGNRQPTDSTPVALEWSREGGIAGFCDRLVISTAGVAALSNCQQESLVEVGRSQLDADQLALLTDKMQELKSFEFEQSDSAVADAMTIKLNFYGNGSVEANEADRQALLDLIDEVFAGIKK